MSVGGYLLLPSGYTNKTVVNTGEFFPPSRILERYSKENKYLPSKTPLLYPCTPKGVLNVVWGLPSECVMSVGVYLFNVGWGLSPECLMSVGA